MASRARILGLFAQRGGQLPNPHGGPSRGGLEGQHQVRPRCIRRLNAPVQGAVNDRSCQQACLRTEMVGRQAAAVARELANLSPETIDELGGEFAKAVLERSDALRCEQRIEKLPVLHVVGAVGAGVSARAVWETAPSRAATPWLSHSLVLSRS